jgi:Uma2 family endonuclease
MTWRDGARSACPLPQPGSSTPPPDWVCEIVSPGHERKDTLHLFLLLQRWQVPYYWIIWPEDRVLIAHQLDGANYKVIATISGQATARIPPFDSSELDLAYILGD